MPTLRHPMTGHVLVMIHRDQLHADPLDRGMTSVPISPLPSSMI
jgi:hypothetical protein